MKLEYNGGYYLQKFDIAFILRYATFVPKSFSEESKKFKQELEPRGTRDLFTFVGPFTNEESMIWIDCLDYVIPYNTFANAPLKELNRKIRRQIREIKTYSESIHAMKRELIDGLIEDYIKATKSQAKIERQELASLEVMRDHLENKIEFHFPDGFVPPTPPKPKKRNIFNRFLGHYRIP